MWPFKKKDPLSAIEKVQTLSVKPNDIVVVTIPRGVPMERRQAARDIFIQAFGPISAKVLIVERGTEVSLVTSAPADPTKDRPATKRRRATRGRAAASSKQQ